MAIPGKETHTQLSSSTSSMDSDEDLKVYCQSCDRDGQRVHVDGLYCTDIEERLCETCLTVHGRHTLSNHHTHTDNNSVSHSMCTASVHPILPDNLTRPCSKHMKEMLKFYCHNHKALICSECVTLEHTDTSCNVSYIPDISDQVLASNDYLVILEAIDNMSEQSCKKSEDVNKMTTKSNSSLVDVLEDIKKFRTELNQGLDELEKHAEDVAKAIQQENDTNQMTVETTCDDVTQTLKTSSDTIKHLYTSKQADKLFMELKLAEKMIKDCEKRIQQLSVYDVKDYTFKPDKELSTLLEKQRLLGTLTERSLKQASPPSSSDVRSRQTSHQGEICVKTSKDRGTSWIRGMTLLSPDILIIIDSSNNKSIKMVDTGSQSVTDQLQLDTWPRDVTSVTGTELAVTLPDKQTIQFVSVSSNTLAKKHTLKVGGNCYGISYCQGKLVVSFVIPAKLQILDINGTVLTTINKENIFSSPLHVTTNASSIYVADGNMRTCTRLNWKGEVIGSYGSTSIPCGLTLSDDGTVFVCHSGHDNIEEISKDCSTGKILLKDLKGPIAVCWCAETSKLYYSSYSFDGKYNNFLHVFKLS